MNETQPTPTQNTRQGCEATQYRLLNHGEIIQEGDEWWSNERWEPDCSANKGITYSINEPIRRPIQSGWIPLSERRPTEADADEGGFVLVRAQWTHTTKTYLDMWNSSAMLSSAEKYHWMPLPKFQAADPDAEAFENWLREAGATDSIKASARSAWDAALKFARGKQP